MLLTLPEPVPLRTLFRKFTLGQGRMNEPDVMVDSFTSDSKEIKPGALFIACRGVVEDGHNYISQVYAEGAAAVVVADLDRLGGKAGFEASNARVLISRLSAYAFKNPSESLRVVGITGTNGKTTTNWMIYHALRALGEGCVRIGTLGYEMSSGASCNESLTTPGPEQLQQILAEARDSLCRNAVLEVSSHALHQHRADDVSLDAAVFTNITHDHLDYHRTFDEYLKAKKRIFNLLALSRKKSRVFCVNLDKAEGRAINKEFGNRFEINASFGSKPGCPVRIVSLEKSRTSTRVSFEIFGKNLEINSNFLGVHNAENLAAALGVLHGFGYDLETLAESFTKIPQTPGRLEVFERNGIAVYIDYAHTPDALEHVLSCLKDLPHSRLLLVFGCGGDRDWRKRSVMGDIAARLADYSVVTSDNPRTEEPAAIIKDIMQSGLVEGANCTILPERAEAIRAVLSMAKEGDIVLIAGKGHEDYQIIGTTKNHFSDMEEVRKFFCNCTPQIL